MIFIQEREWPLYESLIGRSFHRDMLLAEFTVYPTSTVSSWVNTQYNELYHKLDLTDDFNLLQSLGAGVEEPWSVSLFTGTMDNFWDLTEADELKVVSTGAAGIVLTGGFQQIFANYLFNRPWWRLEWKVKGVANDPVRKFQWDLKLIYRDYGTDEIDNTVGISLYRERTTQGHHDRSLAGNSRAKLQVYLPVIHLTNGPSRILIEYGKYVPYRQWLLGLKFGFMHEYRREYDGLNERFSPDRQRRSGIYIQPIWIF
jgi:hypothetical protein